MEAARPYTVRLWRGETCSSGPQHDRPDLILRPSQARPCEALTGRPTFGNGGSWAARRLFPRGKHCMTGSFRSVQAAARRLQR